jgi:hypothetical protein
MQIALFRSVTTGSVVPWDDSFVNHGNRYTRISHWVDVEFPLLPESELVDALAVAKAERIAALHAEIAALKGE